MKHKADIIGIMVVFVILALIVVGIYKIDVRREAHAMGVRKATHAMQVEAVGLNYAYWRVNTDGSTEFVWGTNEVSE